ncbi:NAD(P)H-hydrate dehydratase, partial [Arthrospira platensis SPKY1]|nr:NAD(P)H-hydrate dehydratase [Arthrospira platensis SPKY1]
MFRSPTEAVKTAASAQAVCVCGCGGGETIRSWLPAILEGSPSLVLDADALNAIALDTDLQRELALRATRKWRTVLTPHPMEAARLLCTTSAAIQADRLLAAQTIA